MVGSKGKCFRSYWQMPLRKGCTSSHSRQLCVRVASSRQPCLAQCHVILSTFRQSERWCYLSIASTYSSLIMGEFEHRNINPCSMIYAINIFSFTSIFKILCSQLYQSVITSGFFYSCFLLEIVWFHFFLTFRPCDHLEFILTDGMKYGSNLNFFQMTSQ